MAELGSDRPAEWTERSVAISYLRLKSSCAIKCMASLEEEEE